MTTPRPRQAPKCKAEMGNGKFNISVLWGVLAFVFVVFFAETTCAATCAKSELDQFDFYIKAPVVFRGKVVASKDRSDPAKWGYDYPFGGSYRTQVKVTEVYKGHPGSAITINTDSVQLGKEYVFFPWFDAKGNEYSVTWCSGLIYPVEGEAASGYLEQKVSSRTLLNELEKIIAFDQKGPFRTYYQNGSVKVERHFKKDWRNLLFADGGKLHGEFKNYYKSGQLREEHHYRDGVLHGPSRGYHENGNLWYKAVYKNGKYEGEYTVHNEDGTVSGRSYYKNGVLR